MPDVYDPINAQMSVQSAKERLSDFVTDLLARQNLYLWLYQNNVAPSPTNTLAAFQEATFSGYTRFNVTTFTAVGVDPNANAYVTSQMNAFACNGGGINNNIYGSVLVGTPVGGVQATATNAGSSGGSYGAAFTITNNGAVYTAVPTVRLNGATGSGATAVAVLNANGTFASITLTAAGAGYTTYTVLIDPPLELIKQNVLSAGGIPVALSTDVVTTYAQLIEPSQPL